MSIWHAILSEYLARGWGRTSPSSNDGHAYLKLRITKRVYPRFRGIASELRRQRSLACFGDVVLEGSKGLVRFDLRPGGPVTVDRSDLVVMRPKETDPMHIPWARIDVIGQHWSTAVQNLGWNGGGVETPPSLCCFPPPKAAYRSALKPSCPSSCRLKSSLTTTI